MTQKIKSIICIPIIAAAAIAPVAMIAANNSNNDMMTPLENTSLTVEVPKQDKYTKEQLDEIFNKNYNNKVYKDIFYKTVANPESTTLSTVTVPIKEPADKATITALDAEYTLPLMPNSDFPFGSITFLRTENGDVVYNLTNNLSSLEEGVAEQSDAPINKRLLAIFQNGYPSKIPTDYSLLKEQDFEAGTAIAVSIVSNGYDLSKLDEWFQPSEEASAKEFKAYIKSLLEAEYEEKYIDVNLSKDIDFDSIHYVDEKVAMRGNSIDTNYEQVYIDIYDDRGYSDLSVYNPQLEYPIPADTVQDLFHSGEKFDILLSKQELLGRASLVRNLGHYREGTYDPIKNDSKLICAGEDISNSKYICNDNELYIVQEQTYYQFVDIDMQPEKFSHLFKEYDVNIAFKTSSDGFAVPNICADLYKKDNGGNYNLVDVCSSDENGLYKIIDIQPGEYCLITSGTNDYFENENKFTVGTDNSDLNVLTTYDIEVELKTISANLVIKDENDKPLANTEFKFAIVGTDNEYRATSNENGEIALTDVHPGTYMVSPTSGDYAEFSRFFTLNNTAAYIDAAPIEIKYEYGGEIECPQIEDWSYKDKLEIDNISTVIEDVDTVNQEEPQPIHINEDDANNKGDAVMVQGDNEPDSSDESAESDYSPSAEPITQETNPYWNDATVQEGTNINNTLTSDNATTTTQPYFN